MSSRTSRRGGLSRTVLATALVLPFTAKAATHFPTGARCYDCHAVSQSKMVVGTHLLKKSQKTVDLGITGSSSPVRCLFCHEKNAVSAVGRTEMRGVWDHFDATSSSKHPAGVQSTFTPDGTGLDCLDCHPGLSTGVVSDGAGNARVHGVDAATQTVNLLGTLIGAPANAGEVSAKTCQNAACHDADGGAVGGYAAPARHAMAGVTLAGGAAPTSCTQCHGDHNSYQNTSLIVLRDGGTTSNNLGDPLATRVTPEECGACHTQDDGGTPPYATKGHGRADVNAGSIGCTACHSGAVPHGFARDAAPGNALRFALAQDTSAQSSIRAQAPYNQAFSICLTCHAGYAGKLHQGPTATAGCNDCHEPHGVGVGPNAKMIRAQIPKVDAAGTPVYGDGAHGLTSYETNTYTAAGDATYKTDGTGLCDNAECHQGRMVNGDALHPLSSLLQGGRHSGGDIATGADYNCEVCHKHTDSGGSWGAVDSCTTCHGQPPPAAAAGYATFDESKSPHRRHAAPSTNGGYGLPCEACHLDYTSGATHNTATKTYQSVKFDPARNASTPTYTAGTATCANLYCHSDGQTSASVGSVQWMTGFATPNWSTQDLACNACHGTTTAANTLTYGAPDHPNGTGGHTANSHGVHAAFACSVCHNDTLSDASPADGWTLTGTVRHVNGDKDLKADGTTATFTTGGATTCSAISCHGGGNANWGATLACSDCHLTAIADADDYGFGNATTASANSTEWAAAGHGAAAAYPSGNPGAAFGGLAGDPRGCAYCHAFLGTAQNPSVGHNVGTNPFRLVNKGVLARGASEDGGWNDVCLVCHSALDPDGYDPDGAGGYVARNGTKNVDANHYGAKHAAATQGGAFCWDCHDPHGDTQQYMVHSGDGSARGKGVTDVSDGVYGVPASSRAVTGLDVVDGGYTSDDLVNAGNTGLCQTCHAASGGASYYTRGLLTPPASHNGADAMRCTECHTHPREFSANCTGCHGNTAGRSWWPDGTAEHGAAYANRPGAHQKHVDAIYAANAGMLSGATVTDQKNQTCGWCHPRPGGPRAGTAESGHNADVAPLGTADVHSDGRVGATATSFKNMAGSAVPGGGYDSATQVCSNVACHGGVPTPSWYYAGGAGDALPPAASTVRVNGAAPATVQRGTPTVALTASCSDAASGDGIVVGAEYFVGAMGTPGAGTPMAAADGLFNAATEVVSATVPSAAWSANTALYVDCRDAAGNWGPAGGGSVAVTVTSQSTLVAALASGSLGSVAPGTVDQTVAVATLTWSSGPSAGQVSGVTITGTGTGSPRANVSAVRIFKDGGTVANTWDAGDTLLGTAVMNSSNVAVLSFPTQSVASGSPLRLLVAYNIAAGAANGNTLGAQLTAVAATPGTALTTVLPLSAGTPKTVAALVAATHYTSVDSGTTIATAGQTTTNYAICGTPSASTGSSYTLLSAGAPLCATPSTWINTGGANQALTAIRNTVLDAAHNIVVQGNATGNQLYLGNQNGVAGTCTIQFVDFNPATGVASVIGTGVNVVVPAGWEDTCSAQWYDGVYIGDVNLASITGTILAGHKLGVRITAPSNGFYVVFGGPSYGYLTVNTYPYPGETTPPTLSVAPAAAPATVQMGTPAVTLTATCSDATTGNSKIVGAEYFVGTSGTPGTGVAMMPVPGQFDSPTVAVTAAVDSSGWTSNTTLYVDCKDSQGVWGPAVKGSATVVVTAKDAFIVTGVAGPVETVRPGDVNKVVEVLTFNATAAGTSVQLQGLQVTGTKDLGVGEVYQDVSRVAVYNDTGTVANQWDASDALLGASSFDVSNVSNVVFASPLTVTNPAAARLLVTYDVANAPSSGDRIGGSLTRVTTPATDNLTTTLPVASGFIKSISTAGSCGLCHGLPPSDVATGRSHAKHTDGRADHTDCDACHPGTSGYTTSHVDGKWQLGFGGTAYFGVKTDSVLAVANGGTTYYQDASVGGVDDGTCSNTGCHGAATPVWGSPGSAPCSQCHSNVVNPAAPQITAASAHVDADGGGSTWIAGDCKGCHGGHREGVTVPLPPTSWSNVNLASANMRTVLGINYPIHGGIRLGGSGTSNAINAKTTEAEICWGCHDTVASSVPGNPYVSEWGYNTKKTPAGFPVVQFPTANDGTDESFNFGWLYTSASYATKTSDWTAGYWMDQYDPLLKRRVASVHTASFDAAGQSSSVAANVKADSTVEHASPVLEGNGYIRCSYCHDVHNTFGPSGRPYLRGTWVGNPYPPELPPRPGYTFTTSTTSGTANQPRGRSSSRDKGGYFIDQNSNNPTSNAAMNTLGLTAGLCTLCHGTNVDTMKYYAGSSLWRTPAMTNGHSNSTLGGTGANKKDIFYANRNGTWMQMQNFLGGAASTHVSFGSVYGPYDFTYSGNDIYNTGWYGTDYANWFTAGLIGGAFGPGSMAHKFTCSKCHTPHASGLPALLTQNCVDPAIGGYTQWGYGNQAGNCHRKTSTADGWHRLAPAQ